MFHGNKYTIILHILLIGCIALLAVGFHIVYGYPTGHSYHYNAQWATGFLGQLLSGDVYPRWLVNYPAGLGSPIFYFYAPAPFYLVSFGFLFCQDCSVEQLLLFGHWAIFALSGAAFYVWMSGLTDRRVALFLAGLYILLPYHYLDVEVRNSLGESMAYIWMPLILLGLRHLTSSRYSIALTALAYAGLIFSHLPSAMLFTPIMVIFSYALADRFMLGATTIKLLSTGLLGVALSAIYMVPALMLRDYMAPDHWVSAGGPRFFPENWLLFGDAEIPHIFKVRILSALITSSMLGVLGVGGALFVWRMHRSRDVSFSSGQKAILTAALLSLAVCWFMMTAASQWLWTNLDVLRQVQFPWRVGPIIDFCGATLFGIAIWHVLKTVREHRSTPRALGVKILCTVIVVGMTGCALFVTWKADNWVGRDNGQKDPLIEQIAKQSHLELKNADKAGLYFPVEYRPKWILESTIYASNSKVDMLSDPENAHKYHRQGYRRWVSLVAALPEVRIDGVLSPDGRMSVRREGAKSFRLEANLSEPATLHVRRIYFPSWTLRDLNTGEEILASPNAADGLVAVHLSAGEHKLLLTTRPLMWEIVGLVISALALLLVICLVAFEVTKRVRASNKPC
jgi:hypothetical protein